jgi:chemotaxis protein MotB
MRTTMMAVLAMTLAACGISREQYAAKDAELAKYQKMYSDESSRTEGLQNKVTELDGQLTAAQAKLKAVEDEKTQAVDRASSLAVSNEQRERLAQALERQIKAGQVEITELRGKMTVKLKDKILFASGSAALGRDGRKALDAVADAFKDLRDRNVIVSGYTDSMPVAKTGAFKDNWDLSTARAVAVVRYLAWKGVGPASLGAAGFSQYRPVAPNDTAANRSLNRRIEIALTAADLVPPTIELPKQPVESPKQ